MATVTKALQEECFDGFYAEEEQATADDNDVSTPAYDIGDENPTAAAVSFSLMDKSASSTVDESNDSENLADVLGDPIDSTNTNKRSLDDDHNPFLQPKKKKKKGERQTKKRSGGTSGSGKHAAAASSSGSGGENVNHVNGDGNGAKGDGNENVSAASSGGSGGGQNEAAASSGDDSVNVPAIPPMIEDDGYARADKRMFDQHDEASGECKITGCPMLGVKKGGVCIAHFKNPNAPIKEKPRKKGQRRPRKKRKQIRPPCKVTGCPMLGVKKGGVCIEHFKNPNAPIKEKPRKGGGPRKKRKLPTCKVTGCQMVGTKAGGVCLRHFNDPHAPIKKKPRKKKPRKKVSAEGQPAAKSLKTADDTSSSNAEDAGMEEAELMAAAAALGATQSTMV